MLAIEIELLINQYDANAWGHAHCEGRVDWPPAPWRILRAIVAGAYGAGLVETHLLALQRLIHRLAGQLPSYYLPRSVYTQHRSPRPQVMAGAQVGSGKPLFSAGQLLDADDSSVWVLFPWVELSAEENLILRAALGGCLYLGRREAAARWRVADAADGPAVNAVPDPAGLSLVAIADSSLDVGALWEALTLSAATVHGRDRQQQFPGLLYGCYRHRPATGVVATRPEVCFYRVQLQLEPEVPLPMVRGPELCHLLHRSLVKRCPLPVFTGMDAGGRPLDSHGHAWIQAIPDGRSGRYVDRLLLQAPGGFGRAEAEAIAAVEVLRLPKSWVKVTGCDFDRAPRGEMADRWETRSPFFLQRHPKFSRQGRPKLLAGAYQKDGPEHQALRYLLHLEHLGLDGVPVFEAGDDGLVVRVGDRMVTAVCSEFPRFWEFATARSHGQRVGRTGYHCCFRFDRPVAGPIGVGFAAHSGLGAMLPMRGGWGAVAASRSDSLAV